MASSLRYSAPFKVTTEQLDNGKLKTISLDQTSITSFQDVVDIYNEEKDSILKTTKFTKSTVAPSKLKLQNVQHVLNILMKRFVVH